MKKIVVFLLIAIFVYVFAIVGRAYVTRPMNVQAAEIDPANTQYASPTFIPTRTIVPSATIGYESTLAVAQSTADEARRINAQVTSEAEQRLLSYAQLTADADVRSHEVAMWTQIAGATVIPLTATQQAVANTQIVAAQNIVAAGYTQQAAAPTQMAAIAQAQAVQQFATINEIIKIFAMLLTCVFLLAGISYFVRHAPKEVEEDTPKETTVWVRSEKDNGAKSVRLVVPCTPEQLTELAELAVNGEKKFGINRLEQTSRTFRSQRETLILVRQFFVESKFVIPDANGTVTLNADGEAFLAGWFESHQLPTEYEFEEPKEDEQELEQQEVQA
jgi:hypothetical protein